MDQPLVSILVANYNNGQYLEECIESIFNQTYKNWEIVIVDDGSSDNSKEIINKKYSNNNKIQIYYNKKNKGCGYTKRKAAAMAKGQYCAFLDPDDVILKDAIEILIEVALKKPNYSMYHAKLYKCDEKLNNRTITSTSRIIPRSENYLTSFPYHHISAFCMYDNQMYKQTKGINKRLKKAVDKDLYFKLEEIAPDLYYPDKALYLYRIHHGGISRFSNWNKANYYTSITINDAYKRRKKNNVKNISREKLNTLFVETNKKLFVESLSNKSFKWQILAITKLLYYMRIKDFFYFIISKYLEKRKK